MERQEIRCRNPSIRCASVGEFGVNQSKAKMTGEKSFLRRFVVMTASVVIRSPCFGLEGINRNYIDGDGLFSLFLKKAIKYYNINVFFNYSLTLSMEYLWIHISPNNRTPVLCFI